MKPASVPAALAVLAAPIVPSGTVANADRVNWGAVAECESGGDWSADTGNGAYGGLQIKESTWEANGGAGSPANASPQQQVQVAKRILATQGPAAWPECMSRGRDRAGIPPGSVSHFLTLLMDHAGIPG